MQLRLQAALLLLASVTHAQETNGVSLSGTAINTTNPDSPLAAPITFALGTGTCALTVSPPLFGSGMCHVKSYDATSGRIEIVSDGPPAVIWSGTIKGNLASGTYAVEHQTGSFYLAVLKQRPTPPPAAQIPAPSVPRGRCSPAIESSITGEVHGWDGETLFKLDNGQIWQQAEYDYNYFYEYHPDVTIYSTSSGCTMKVEDEEETVVVKRIK